MISQKLPNILRDQKKLFFLCVCIIWLILAKRNIRKEWHRSNIDGIGTLWLNEKHIEEKLGHKNLPVITNKYDQVYKKHRYELVD